MRLDGRRQSGNVDDRRGRASGIGGKIAGGGIVGVIIACVIAWMSGGNPLEVLVGGDEGEGGGLLVALAALDADDAVLDHVDAPEAVAAGDVVELADEGEHGHGLAVEGHGYAPVFRGDKAARAFGKNLQIFLLYLKKFPFVCFQVAVF